MQFVEILVSSRLGCSLRDCALMHFDKILIQNCAVLLFRRLSLATILVPCCTIDDQIINWLVDKVTNMCLKVISG